MSEVEVTSGEAADAAYRAIPDARQADGELPYAVFAGPFVLSWWTDHDRPAVHYMIMNRDRSQSGSAQYGTLLAHAAATALVELHQKLIAAR